MSAGTSTTIGKSKVESLAKPDGSFAWTIDDVLEELPSRTSPDDIITYSYIDNRSHYFRRVNNVVQVNGTTVNVNEVEIWAAIFSSDVLQKLDSISIKCSLPNFRILRPHFLRLCTPPSIPCKPFNLSIERLICCGMDLQEEEQLLSMIACLIRQNRLHTVNIPYACETIRLDRTETLLEITDAIIVTHSLISLHWDCAINWRSNETPSSRQLVQAILGALEKNISLTEVDFYIGAIGGSAQYLWHEDIIIPLLSRNKALPSLNAAIAAGKADGDWDGSCPSNLVRRLIADKFNIHHSFFNSDGDMCFCHSCHKKSGNKMLYTRGVPPFRYTLPVGWMRLGLKVHEGFAASNDIFNKWHISYHGTVASNLEPIFRGGLQLLKPGDVALGGAVLGIRSGHIPKAVRRTNRYSGLEELFDINQIFTSPSIRYSSHPAYAQQFVVDHPERPGVRIGMRFIFQCRQRPGSYTIGQETVGARDTKLDPHFDNNELEWYTKENSAIVLSGLCAQVRYVS